MLTRIEFISSYWNYYLMLEEKFINTMNYIELTIDNYSTYSIEFTNQIQSIGSEIDVFMKQISGYQSIERKNINDYANAILSVYPNIIAQEVKVIDKAIILKPFEGWNTIQPSKSLFWWENYNSIKHGRVGNLRNANLKNVVYLLAALYTLEIYYLNTIIQSTDELDIPDRESKIFSLINWNYKYMSMSKMVCELTEDGKPIIGGDTF